MSSFLYHLHTVTFYWFVCNYIILNNVGHCAKWRVPRRSAAWNNVISALTAPLDFEQFLMDSYMKMGQLDCTTVIWESSTSFILGSISFCVPEYDTCAYKYTVNYQGNVSENLEKALKASNREQCGGYIILLKTPKSITNFLRQGDDSRLINTRGRFLIWYQKKDESFERDEIWKKFPNVILFNMTTNTRTRRLSFTTLEMKWPPVSEESKESVIRAIDFWRYGKGFKDDTKWYWDKTSDLKNLTLKVLVVEHPPGVIKLKSPTGKVGYAGVEIEIVKTLKTKMNFNIELVDGDSDTKLTGGGGQEMGASNVTQNFYGAISSLIDGETDMAIGSFFILKHYLEFIDMSIPLDVVCTSFLTPSPLPRPRYLALILPFNWKLWILVLSMCLIFAPLCLYCLSHIRFHGNEYRVFRERCHVILTSFSLMCQVSLHIWPKFWSIRMFIGSYWLFTLFITLAYRGAMVSFLSIPFFEPPIDNIQELAASGLRIGGWGVELQRLFTQHQAGNTDNDVKAVLAKKYQVVDKMDHGISMVAQGNFALYENIRFLRFIRLTRNLSKAGRPSMRVMKQCIVPVHIGIAYQKNSAITLTINRHLRRFGESGLTKKWGSRLVQLTKEFDRAQNQRDHHNDREKSGDHDGDEEETSGQQKERVLTIADLQGLVYILLFGILVSIFVFIVELTFVHTSATTNDNVNRLTKFVKITVSKTKSVIDDRKFLVDYETNFEPRIRQRNKERKKKLFRKKQPPYPFPYID